MARDESGVPIPGDWDGETYCCYSVMWPASFEWRAILNGLVDSAGTGWYYDAGTGNVIEAKNAVRATWSYNFRNEEVVMTCSEATNDLLTRMADALEALAAAPCCPAPAQPGGGGSRGAGTTVQPPNPYVDDGDNYPPDEGWEDRTEWQSHKCNAAWDIINNLTQDLLGLSAVKIALTTGITGWVAVLIGVLLTPIPFDDLAALAAILITSSLLYGLMAELSVVIGDNRDDLVCVLYNADDASQAQDALESAIGALIDNNFSSPGNSFLHQVVNYLVTYDSVNTLYVNKPTNKQDADCSSCGGEASTYVVEFGGVETSVPAGNANPIEGSMTFVSGWGCPNTREMALNDFPEGGVTITSIVLTGDGISACSGHPLFNYFYELDYNDLILATSTDPQTGGPVEGVRSMYILTEQSGGDPLFYITYEM